jgi:hypothetical protein
VQPKPAPVIAMTIPNTATPSSPTAAAATISTVCLETTQGVMRAAPGHRRM